MAKFLSLTSTLFLGLFLSLAKVYADIPAPPGPIPYTNANQSALIIAGGIAVGIVVLVSWLIIRAIRRK